MCLRERDTFMVLRYKRLLRFYFMFDCERKTENLSWKMVREPKRGKKKSEWGKNTKETTHTIWRVEKSCCCGCCYDASFAVFTLCVFFFACRETKRKVLSVGKKKRTTREKRGKWASALVKKRSDECFGKRWQWR